MKMTWPNSKQTNSRKGQFSSRLSNHRFYLQYLSVKKKPCISRWLRVIDGCDFILSWHRITVHVLVEGNRTPHGIDVKTRIRASWKTNKRHDEIQPPSPDDIFAVPTPRCPPSRGTSNKDPTSTKIQEYIYVYQKTIMRNLPLLYQTMETVPGTARAK